MPKNAKKTEFAHHDQQAQQADIIEKDQQAETADSEQTAFDFSKGVDGLCQQLQQVQPRKRLHILRNYVKFKRYFINKYEVECVIPDEKIPNLIVRFSYSGSYNFVLAYRSNRGMSKAAIFMDTRDIPENVAEIIYYAVLALVIYIERDFSIEALKDAEKAGYIIRRASFRPTTEENFCDWLKLFQ
jgi:hypothetical protein